MLASHSLLRFELVPCKEVALSNCYFFNTLTVMMVKIAGFNASATLIV